MTSCPGLPVFGSPASHMRCNQVCRRTHRGTPFGICHRGEFVAANVTSVDGKLRPVCLAAKEPLYQSSVQSLRAPAPRYPSLLSGRFCRRPKSGCSCFPPRFLARLLFMRLTFCLLGFKLSLCPVESFLCPRLDFLFARAMTSSRASRRLRS